jgi:hypothetical protein
LDISGAYPQDPLGHRVKEQKLPILVGDDHTLVEGVQDRPHGIQFVLQSMQIFCAVCACFGDFDSHHLRSYWQGMEIRFAAKSQPNARLDHVVDR